MSLIEKLNEAFAKDPSPDAIVQAVFDPFARPFDCADLTEEILAHFANREVVFYYTEFQDFPTRNGRPTSRISQAGAFTLHELFGTGPDCHGYVCGDRVTRRDFFVMEPNYRGELPKR